VDWRPDSVHEIVSSHVSVADRRLATPGSAPVYFVLFFVVWQWCGVSQSFILGAQYPIFNFMLALFQSVFFLGSDAVYEPGRIILAPLFSNLRRPLGPSRSAHGWLQAAGPEKFSQ
jgi:hypothetical protein